MKGEKFIIKVHVVSGRCKVSLYIVCIKESKKKVHIQQRRSIPHFSDLSDTALDRGPVSCWWDVKTVSLTPKPMTYVIFCALFTTFYVFKIVLNAPFMIFIGSKYQRNLFLLMTYRKKGCLDQIKIEKDNIAQ